MPWKAYLNTQDGNREEDKGQYDTPRQIECAPTCCLLITPKTFETIGLMDEKYFVYFDDTDFCLRAFRAGLKMYLLPTATLIHKESSLTGGIESDFVMKYINRNMVYYIRKSNSVLGAVFWLICLELVMLRRFFFKKDSKETYLLRQRSFIEGLKM